MILSMCVGRSCQSEKAHRAMVAVRVEQDRQWSSVVRSMHVARRMLGQCSGAISVPLTSASLVNYSSTSLHAISITIVKHCQNRRLINFVSRQLL